MSSSTPFNHDDFKPLELRKNLYVKCEKTTKVSDTSDRSTDEAFLSFHAECDVNYESDVLQMKFRCYKFAWNLKKIQIFYNGKITKENLFPDGILSSGLFNEISFEFTIADMNIPFYDKSSKSFVFALMYEELEGDDVYETRFSLDLPKFSIHHEFSFKNLLGFYHPDKIITSFFNNDFEAADDSTLPVKVISIEFSGFRRMKTLLNRFESYGYCNMFWRMMSLEDLTVRKALNDLSMTNKFVRPTSMRHHFEVYFDGKILSEKLGFNHLVLTPMSVFDKLKDLSTPEIENERIYNQITNIDGSRVVFEKPRSKYITLTVKYHVQLVENRVPSRLALKALERIEKLKLEAFFTNFNEKTLEKQVATKFNEVVENFECCNESIGTNQSQMEAVKHIVDRTSFPSPYIVFGPPGTGKTSTLVEAIAQIVKLQPTAKILVTANSNAACDEIGERLLKFVPRYMMHRLYSPSFDISFPDRHMRLSKLLKPMSNMKHDVNQYPSYEEFYSYNVVISTLVNCGRMITANIKPSHFNYIFIDECASTVEPLSIIPIASLGAGDGRVTAQVILAGDHKQLQGMVHAYFNEKHGFGVSLMERVMMLEKYQFPYDPRFVTQLTDNFRSHWAILRFSNFHFYHSVLRAKQTKEVADFALGWERLPNKCFPLIFHSILAPSEMDGTSLFNVEEVHVVWCYVNTLLRDGIEDKKVTSDDIGIICPYGAQRKRLQEKFKGIDGLEIGTVDAFQGREKLIIIMSTVRSQTPTVGFLKNEKRLNVALTRAKALLIVIGNGETLQQNKLWYKFLNYCYQHGALVGERFMLRYRKPGAEKKVEKPHPMFQIPKVAANYRSYRPIFRSDVKVVPETTEVSPNETRQAVSDDEFETADESHGTSDDSAWLSDSSTNSDSGSDVSWTHEDHRMKARTAKFKKVVKIVAMRPRVTINVLTKKKKNIVKQSSDDEISRKLSQLKLGDANNNNNVGEILVTWSTISAKINNMKSFINDMVKRM